MGGASDLGRRVRRTRDHRDTTGMRLRLRRVVEAWQGCDAKGWQSGHRRLPWRRRHSNSAVPAIPITGSDWHCCCFLPLMRHPGAYPHRVPGGARLSARPACVACLQRHTPPAAPRRAPGQHDRLRLRPR
ncbi:hypothetical protein [Lysobacter gummosus]|uniref:hypothetical protein n=1 Tax=Lysobacter gummosus TaxID=262324 RepID=UPI00362706DF